MRFLYLALSALVLVIGLGEMSLWDRSMALQLQPGRLQLNREQMVIISKSLQQYNRAKGRYPANDEGLLVVWPTLQIWNDPEHVSYSYRLGADESGILTIWGEPFIYENRRGLEPGRFALSGVNKDPGRIYSTTVDDGIYIWSLAAQQSHAKYVTYHPIVVFGEWASVLGAVLFFALFVVASRRSARSAVNVADRRTNILLSLLGGGAIWLVVVSIIFPCFVKTCYEWSTRWHRRPKLTADYITVITKYRDAGVISDKAYGKIIMAMKANPSGRAAKE